jgi:hypothetical protein
LRESHRDNSQIPTVALRPACRSNFAARLIYDALAVRQTENALCTDRAARWFQRVVSMQHDGRHMIAAGRLKQVIRRKVKSRQFGVGRRENEETALLLAEALYSRRVP